jgi:hypothetical protein
MSELGDFLAAYTRSYETYDPAKVAEFIHCPCVFFIRDDCVLLDTKPKINEFIQAGLKAYRASDCVRFKARLLDERRIGPRFALIDVEWSPENAAGKRTMLFWTTYNLVRHEGDWKASMITRHDQ